MKLPPPLAREKGIEGKKPIPVGLIAANVTRCEWRTGWEAHRQRDL